MDTSKEANEIGCYNIAGAIIRQALYDYQFYGKRLNMITRKKADNNRARFYYEQAESFLFNKNRLEQWLEMTGLDRHVNICYVRHVAKNSDVLGQRKLENVSLREIPNDDKEIFTEP